MVESHGTFAADVALHSLAEPDVTARKGESQIE
jgi:hypothetical protein